MVKKVSIFSGNANPALAQEIAQVLETPLGQCRVSRFSDGETFCEIRENVRGADTYVIQPTCSPVNDNVMELLIMADALRRASAGSITAVMPYYGYARQDRKVAPRTPITSKLVADLIVESGIQRVVCVDLHAGQIQGFFSIPGDVLTAFHILNDYLKALQPSMKDPVVVTADLGFAKKARNFAAGMNIPLAFIEKRRSGNDAKAEALTLIGDANGRDVIIVDDEIDTGGSIAQAVNLVKSCGARNVYVSFVHPVFSLNAAQRLSALPVTQFITTDTIPIPPADAALFGDRLKILTVSALLGEVIRRANEGRSVGEMFNE